MGATIKDVAKLAKVSPSTVSRVLSNNAKISDETKERVFKAIKELDYHPNAIARNLANNSTNTLGFIIPNEVNELFKNPFFVQVMTGISLCAHEKGYYIMYTFSNSEEEEVAFISKYTQSKLVDGIILLTSRSEDKCIKFLRSIDFPFVVVGRPEDPEEVMWVDNDNFKAMYNLVDNLITRGASSVAFIGGSKAMNVSKDRFDGYRRALIAHGKNIDENLIIDQQNFNEQSGYEAMKKILKYGKPDAVVTTDDLLAFGVLKFLNDMNIEDISVVGFNNTPLCAYHNPPLASVDINAEKLGYYAAKLMIDTLKKEAQPLKHYIIDTYLEERKSIKL